jgi:hypothetical protein
MKPWAPPSEVVDYAGWSSVLALFVLKMCIYAN